MSDSVPKAQEESTTGLSGLIERINKRFVELINPRITLLALLASFSLCVLLGYNCSKEVLIKDFVRFHAEISMDTQFLPTFSQLYKMAASRAKKSKYLVIVSGDSIFYGAGQSVERVWTRRLEKILGPDYKVINFAFRGGAALESGYWVLEALSKNYDNVFLVGNTWGTNFTGPIGMTPYSYHFWDAKAHGFLRKFPKRSKMVDIFAAALTNQDAFYRLGNDTPLQMELDSVLYFKDLWTTFYYRCFSPMWFSTAFLLPRYAYEDTTPSKFPPLGSDEYRWLNTILEQHAELITAHADGTYDLNEGRFYVLQEMLKKSVLPSLRPRILMVEVDVCPLFLEKIAAPTLALRKRIVERSAQIYEKLGFNAMIIDDLKNEDFVDGRHLSPSGGDKIAELIAARLKELTTHPLKEPPRDELDSGLPGSGSATPKPGPATPAFGSQSSGTNSNSIYKD